MLCGLLRCVAASTARRGLHVRCALPPSVISCFNKLRSYICSDCARVAPYPPQTEVTDEALFPKVCRNCGTRNKKGQGKCRLQSCGSDLPTMGVVRRLLLQGAAAAARVFKLAPRRAYCTATRIYSEDGGPSTLRRAQAQPPPDDLDPDAEAVDGDVDKAVRCEIKRDVLMCEHINPNTVESTTLALVRRDVSPQASRAKAAQHRQLPRALRQTVRAPSNRARPAGQTVRTPPTARALSIARARRPGAAA